MTPTPKLRLQLLTVIHDLDDGSINFGGRQIVHYGFGVAIMGNIDRVTGRTDVTTVPSDPTKQPDPNSAVIHYDVICKASTAPSEK
jgi:hypothetical protein